MEMKDLITIVIPCKNESYNISNLLSNINSQYYIKDVNIYVADSSDDVSTNLHILSQTDKETKIHIIEGGLPSTARHNGALLCKTPYILFLDSDMVIESPVFISNILNEIIKRQGSLLTCKVRTTDTSYDKLYKSFDLIQKLHKITGPFALGGIMLFETKTYFELGGFNPEDVIAEDYNLSRKVPSDKFILSNKIIKTSPRRFKNKGVYYMVKLMVKTFINRNNKNFYKKSHSYWS
jgi:glycosyltransferase involved in cell wall biosynthesis